MIALNRFSIFEYLDYFEQSNDFHFYKKLWFNKKKQKKHDITISTLHTTEYSIIPLFPMLI